MLDDPLTEKIIGCAYKVYNTLGAGFLEAVYKRALIIELSRTELPFAMEAPIKVLYGDKIVGSYYADIIVNDSIIVEIKAVDNIVKVHEVQLVNYLHATGIPIGLLINFGSREIGIKRKYRDR
ncbi:MAG: GxxExxY protein, partial [Rectinemataceae bacterium]